MVEKKCIFRAEQELNCLHEMYPKKRDCSQCPFKHYKKISAVRGPAKEKGKPVEKRKTYKPMF